MSQQGMTREDFSFSKLYQFELVAACYQSDKIMAYTSEHLRLEDFSMPTCQVVWEALDTYWKAQGKRPTEPEVSLLIRDIVSDEVGKYKSSITDEELEGLASLLEMVFTHAPVNDEFMLGRLPDVLKKARVKRIVEDFDQHNPNQLLQDLMKESEKLDITSRKEKRSTLCDDLGLIETDEENLRVSTGCSRLDRKLDGGPMPGDLAIVIACSGVGKSNMLSHFSVAAATNYFHSLFLTLELAPKKIRQRAFSMMSGVEGSWLKVPTSRWPERELLRRKVMKSKEFGISSYLSVEDMTDRSYHPLEIGRKITEWKRGVVEAGGREEDCKLVVLDWLDMLRPMDDRPSANPYLMISETMHHFKRVAQQHQLVIYTASQGTRDADGKAILRMKDTAAGFHKNDAVDYGFGLGNDEDAHYDMSTIDEAEETAEGVIVKMDKHVIMNVYKNRNGDTGPVRLYQAPTLRFYDSREQYTRHMHDLENPNLSPQVMAQISRSIGKPLNRNITAPGIMGM